MQGRRENKILWWILPLLVTCGAVVQLVMMAKNSALSWTFQQPQYWSAVAEITVCFAILALGQLALRDKPAYAIGLTATVILIFSYIHQYLIALLIGGLYVLFLFMLGFCLCKWCRLNECGKSWQLWLVMGMAGMLLLAAAASALKMGTPEKLRVIVGAVFLLLIFVEGKGLWSRLRIRRKEAITGRQYTWQEILIFSGIVAFVLIQVGRANIALDYDSVWYGLRSEYMLAPETGIYDPMPFLACVHTYAKGTETLALPLSGLGSYGIVYSLNILFGVAIIRCCYDICRLVCERRASMLAALCVSAIPGIMNMTVTAKSDIITLFLQLAAVWFLAGGMQKKEAGHYILCLSCGVLSFAFKSSSLLFSSVILLLCVASLILHKPQFCEKGKRTFLFAGFALAALSVIWLRTYLLSGTPVTFLLPGLIRRMGGEIKYPYEFYSMGTASMGDLLNPELLGARLLRVLNILFYPNTAETDHVIIAWGGPIFAFLWMVSFSAIVFRIKRTWHDIKSGTIQGLAYALFLLLSILILGCAVLLSKPDGNYFILLYAATAITSIFLCEKAGTFCKSHVGTLAVPLLVTAALFTCAVNWSWALGFTKADVSAMGYYNSGKQTERYMDSSSLGDIYKKLKAEDKPKIEIFSSEINSVRIPAITDTWVSHRSYGGIGTTTSVEKYWEYLRFAEMDYLLLEREYLKNDAHAVDIISELAKMNRLSMSMSNDAWALVEIRADGDGLGKDVLTFVKGIKLNAIQGIYDDGWAAQQLVFEVISNETGNLVISGYTPWADLKDAYIDVTVDGAEADRYLLQNGIVSITIPLAEGAHSIALESNFARAADAPDVRTDLAFVMTSFEFVQ